MSPEIVSVSLNRGFLGHAYLEQGDATSAIAALEPAVETVASIPITSAERRLLALLSEAQLLAGAVERARETAGRALALSRADGMPFNVGLAARALGRIARADGDLEAAERDLAAALEAFTECGACFEGARTRLDLARLRAEQGRGNVAREHLETAVGAFDVAGAPKRVAEARALARALGIDLEAQAGMNMGGGR